MIELTMQQARYMADICQADNELERDFKFETWINRRKYMITTAELQAQARERARDHGIEVLIIKD